MGAALHANPSSPTNTVVQRPLQGWHGGITVCTTYRSTLHYARGRDVGRKHGGTRGNFTLVGVGRLVHTLASQGPRVLALGGGGEEEGRACMPGMVAWPAWLHGLHGCMEDGVHCEQGARGTGECMASCWGALPVEDSKKLLLRMRSVIWDGAHSL